LLGLTCANDLFCHARARLGASPPSDMPAASLSPEQDERAAALLVGLWAAAARYGIARDQSGCTLHLPGAALDTTGTAGGKRASRSIHNS
jgi:hypothetical protein